MNNTLENILYLLLGSIVSPIIVNLVSKKYFQTRPMPVISCYKFQGQRFPDGRILLIISLINSGDIAVHINTIKLLKTSYDVNIRLDNDSKPQEVRLAISGHDYIPGGELIEFLSSAHKVPFSCKTIEMRFN